MTLTIWRDGQHATHSLTGGGYRHLCGKPTAAGPSQAVPAATPACRSCVDMHASLAYPTQDPDDAIASLFPDHPDVRTIPSGAPWVVGRITLAGTGPTLHAFLVDRDAALGVYPNASAALCGTRTASWHDGRGHDQQVCARCRDSIGPRFVQLHDQAATYLAGTPLGVLLQEQRVPRAVSELTAHQRRRWAKTRGAANVHIAIGRYVLAYDTGPLEVNVAVTALQEAS